MLSVYLVDAPILEVYCDNLWDTELYPLHFFSKGEVIEFENGLMLATMRDTYVNPAYN